MSIGPARVRYEVTAVIGRRQTLVYEAADETEARAMCEHGDEPIERKHEHSTDEIVVVADPVLAELTPGDSAAKGLTSLMRRPGEIEDEARKRVFEREQRGQRPLRPSE
jgi:hypothetical protein